MAYITLNRNNFYHNLDIIAKRTKSVDKIALVLKDNAYGHGLLEMAKLAKEYGVKKAVVCTSKEASVIEELFDYILVLGEIPEIKSEKVRYTINDIKSIEKFPKGSKVELKVDTGMHRNGILMEEIEEAFKKIEDSELVLESVFTHHASADELTSEWFWQNENFKGVKKKSVDLAKKHGFDQLRFHSSNSASLFRHSDFTEDMARVGIAAYGCMKLPRSLQLEELKPVLSLYASRVSSRELKKGQRVGYSATYEMKEDAVVSNYDFGYGDGFLRSCSNNYQTPQNRELVGRVSMDNSSFLSDDDELLLFNDARVVAQSSGTISYEVLTSLKPHIKREYI